MPSPWLSTHFHPNYKAFLLPHLWPATTTASRVSRELWPPVVTASLLLASLCLQAASHLRALPSCRSFPQSLSASAGIYCSPLPCCGLLYLPQVAVFTLWSLPCHSRPAYRPPPACGPSPPAHAAPSLPHSTAQHSTAPHHTAISTFSPLVLQRIATSCLQRLRPRFRRLPLASCSAFLRLVCSVSSHAFDIFSSRPCNAFDVFCSKSHPVLYCL